MNNYSASCAWKFENWLKTNKFTTLNIKSRLKVISGQDFFKMSKILETNDRGCRWCFLKLKICRSIINLFCLWVLCAWKFENWLKTHNDMTLNIKPCSKPCAGRKELNCMLFFINFYSCTRYKLLCSTTHPLHQLQVR